MSLSVNRSLDISAAFGFLVLFPGFVAYHFAIIAGWMPAFAGGLFGSASLVVAAVSLIHFAGRLQGPYGYPVLEIAFVIFCAYLAVWTVVASALIAGRSYAEPSLLESFATLSIWLAVFFVGTRFSVPTPAGRMILWAAAVTIVALFAFAMYSKNSFIGPFIMFGEDSDTAAEGASTYQGIGRSVLVTAIVIGSIQTRFWKQMLVLAATVVCLLALGSRAHLFVAILVMISLVVLQGFRRRNRGTGIVLVIVAIPVIYLAADIFLRLDELAKPTGRSGSGFPGHHGESLLRFVRLPQCGFRGIRAQHSFSLDRVWRARLWAIRRADAVRTLGVTQARYVRNSLFADVAHGVPVQSHCDGSRRCLRAAIRFRISSFGVGVHGERLVRGESRRVVAAQNLRQRAHARCVTRPVSGRQILVNCSAPHSRQ